MFFLKPPRCFGPLGKFQHNIKISIKTVRVSRLSVSCDYGKMYFLFYAVAFDDVMKFKNLKF